MLESLNLDLSFEEFSGYINAINLDEDSHITREEVLHAFEGLLNFTPTTANKTLAYLTYGSRRLSQSQILRK